jgi:hypothetical protein
MKYIIFDIDGVLADSSRRLHHIMKTPKDWNSFFSYEEMMQDDVIESGISLLESLAQCDDYRIIFFTGRPEKTRKTTNDWFYRQCAIVMQRDWLLMRPDNDRRNDDLLKEEWLLEIGPKNILCAFDDRSRIVKMYRKHGVICYQAAEGDF